ncbi:MAG: hypothetical protein IT190_04875 [Microbacteriaceae bacterium]|nr:hypothetical protein [Microbacteriaceae bacterium]
MRLTLPTDNDLIELTKHRDAGSVSIYLPSTPITRDVDAVQLALKTSAFDAEAQLRGLGIHKKQVDDVLKALENLQSDREFWGFQGHSLAIFVAPGVLHAYRLANSLHTLVAVGDRFDIGPLLRSVTFTNGGYVLSVAEGHTRLLELSAHARPIELALDLPDELDGVLDDTKYQGRFDRHRADGTTGERVERERFCRLVQDAVLTHVAESSLPMILAASADLEPAYRAVNTYRGLLADGINANPEALSVDELNSRAREILDELYENKLAEWRELFGTRRANGLATSQLSEVARAATASGVDSLMLDMDSTLEGSIDDSGVVHEVTEPDAESYGIVDEIAARVLRSGGTVKAVRAGDLPDSTPVAAMLRFPM